LLDAFDKLDSKNEKLKLLIFGGGKYLQDLRIRYSHNPSISFMGFRDNFTDYLDIADCYVHISAFDNQPYALVDAMMHSKVVICNDLEALREMVDPLNNFVTSLDSKSIYSIFQTFLKEIKNEPDKFKARGEQNRLLATTLYSSDIISRKYIDLYEKILAQ
jgi:glycosyltransferase involved in cell wall biosynthesis